MIVTKLRNLALLAVSFLAVGCIDGIRVGSIKSASDVATLCKRHEVQTERVAVDFPAQTEQCPWADADSLKPAEGYFTARAEQSVPLDLPADTIICDMVLDLWGPDPDDEQSIIYDDHFFFMFDEVILAASYGKSVEYLQSDGLLHFWDWDRVAGVKYTFMADRTPYCLGEDQGRADCDIPSTQLKGPVSLDYDSGIIAELSHAAIEAGTKDFGFVTVGDNDDTDCQHDAFSLLVDVAFLQP